jgi:hypothetical protein
MGVIGLTATLCVLAPLAGAGCWLGHELDGEGPQLHAHVAGGALFRVHVMQAILAGVVLVAAGCHLWLRRAGTGGAGRSPRPTRWASLVPHRRADKVGLGRASPGARYALLLLAISVSWSTALMGLVRAAIGRTWLVSDDSAWPHTPAIGDAAVWVNVVVLVFFALVATSTVIARPGDARNARAGPASVPGRWSWLRSAGCLTTPVIAATIVVAAVTVRRPDVTEDPAVAGARRALARQSAALERGPTTEPPAGPRRMPIERVFELIVEDPDLLRARDR